MSNAEFRRHIRFSIADGQLQAALDANAERRSKGRIEAFASLPNWQERRRRAHEVRADVIAHLTDYLAAFRERITRNGIRVHDAKNADEAVGLILEIANPSRSGRRLLFAKSKSMVSEEIELNRALEGHGHRVVETDLGEYIVQLRGEKPAHIITPAVHLQRRQVGELFHHKLGLPLTEDIPTLTAAARRELREVFLRADVGISGVNFGVAETGTMCVVTNEGNGRMVTTVPPVHIALMGMERLVRNLDDLALMLSLLPRSATGQKLSVYTQLIHSPRRGGESDGPRERHLIIVDNGRSRLRDSRLREALYCIRCGACLNACPVFREIGGHAYVGADDALAPYPGPIGSIVSPGLLGLPRFGQLAQASSLCGACKDACPVDIDLPMLLTRVRAGATKGAAANGGNGLTALSRLSLAAYARIASSAGLFGAAQKLAAFASRLVSPTSEWIRLPAFTGWGLSKDFPRPAGRPFRARWGELVSPSAIEHSSPESSVTLQTEAASQQGDAGPSELSAESGSRVDRFMTELQALGASVFRTSSSEIEKRVMQTLQARAIDAVLAWDAIEGIREDEMVRAGLRFVHEADAGIAAGFTGCSAAIAETGTLVLTSGEGRLLSASLLPEVHIAIVKSAQIVWSLEQAMQLPAVTASSATVLVTGPSRTADIEMTLTIGVHGPKELIVFIVEEEGHPDRETADLTAAPADDTISAAHVTAHEPPSSRGPGRSPLKA